MSPATPGRIEIPSNSSTRDTRQQFTDLETVLDLSTSAARGERCGRVVRGTLTAFDAAVESPTVIPTAETH